MNVFDAYLQDKPSAFYKFDHTGTSFPNQMGDSRALTSTLALSRALNTPIVNGSAGPVLVGGTNTPKIPSDRLSSASKKNPVSLECWVVPRLVGAPTQAPGATVSNLIPNPRLAESIAHWVARWFGGSPGTGTTSWSGTNGPVLGAGYFRKTWTVSPPQNGDTGFQLYRGNSQNDPIAARAWAVTEGQPWTFSGYLRSSVNKTGYARLYWYRADGSQISSTSGALIALPPGQWTRLDVSNTAPTGAVYVTPVLDVFQTGSIWQPGDTLDVSCALLEQSSTLNDYFDGDTPDTNNYRYAWSGTPNESNSFRYSPGPVGIFSHTTLDGITFDGEKINFSVNFQNEPPAVASWYVPDYISRYHIVGVFSGQKVSLFIDGVMVSEADLTEAQMSDDIVTPSDSYLYLGTSSTSEVILIDAPAIYEYTLSSSSIVNHFIAGATSRGVVDNVMSFGGRAWTFDDFDRNIAMSSDVELSSGLFSSATYLDGVRPTIDDTLTSEAGTWTTSIPVAATGLSTIDGVKISWEGDGYFTVTASFDLGSTWTAPLENGQLIPGTVGMDPTGKEIDIKVAFVGGIVNDISVIRELSYVVYPDSIIKSDNSTRTVTLNGDISTASILSQPLDSYQNAGLRIPAGDTATIDPDTSDDPQDIQTIEILFNVESIDDGEIVDGLSIVSGAFDFTDTVYFNGSSTVPPPVANQWFHVVIVVPANNNSVTIGGGSQMNVAMAAVYKDALSSDEAMRLYTSYFGNVTTTVTESSALSVQESAQMYNLYDYDWQIISGGR